MVSRHEEAWTHLRLQLGGADGREAALVQAVADLALPLLVLLVQGRLSTVCTSPRSDLGMLHVKRWKFALLSICSAGIRNADNKTSVTMAGTDRNS